MASNNESLHKITEKFLKNKTKEFDITCIYSINLSSLGIFDLGCIGNCTGLIILDLSRNNISSLQMLAPLKQLQILNVSHNRIANLSGMEDLESLFSLNLCSNFISSTDALLPLSKLDKLRQLRLNDAGLSNPLCQHNPKYKEEVISLITGLKVLDGQILNGKGSEFFELCQNLDQNLQKVNIDPRIQYIAAPLTEEYPSIADMLNDRHIDDHMINQEKRLEDLLNECDVANKKAKAAAKIAEDNLSYN